MRYINVGDELVTREDINEAITWCDVNMDSGPGATFTNGMHALKKPLAKWSAGTEYKGLHPGADKAEIRKHLQGKLANAITAEETGGQGFANQADKVAVEKHAMTAARAHYEEEGWKEDEADKDACMHNPFDLILTRDGVIMHAEVKGTRAKFKGIPSPPIKVTLTANEVAYAQHCAACSVTELFILTDIELGAAFSGEPHVRAFKFSEENLRPTQYRYTASQCQ